MTDTADTTGSTGSTGEPDGKYTDSDLTETEKDRTERHD
jgi:hypothetical protein